MGVNALAVGAIKSILHRWPEARVFLLDYAKAPRAFAVEVGTSRITVPIVNMRFSKKVYLHNHILVLLGLVLLAKLIPSKAARRWLIRRNACLSVIDGVDLVASVAGGDSFSDMYGLTRFFYVALPQLLCILAGKRLVLMPQTLGPFRKPIVRATAKYILRNAELVYSRDYQGVGQAADLIGHGRARREPRFSPDLGLLLDPSSKTEQDIVGLAPRVPGCSLIGLNVSGLLFKAGGKVETRSSFKTNYETLIPKLIDFLLATKQSQVLLIPHVFGTTSESDSAVCQRVYNELRARFPGRLGLATGSYDQHQIKHLIGSCDFFIGSRMHACIAAASQAVPAVSIAYSDKFIGVMETLGIACLVADLRLVNETEILALIGSAFDGRIRYRERLEQEMPKWRHTVLNLFADVNIVPAL